MSVFENAHATYSIVLVVSFVLFYFLINYKVSSLVDDRFAKQEKRAAKKAAILYKKYGMGVREKAAEQHKMAHMMRERDAARERMERHHRTQLREESDEDSVKNVGGFNSSGNHASFEENDD